MNAKLISGPGCDGGNCPAVYVTDSGSILVQGDNIDTQLPDGVGLGTGESVVEIPRSVLEAAISRLQTNG